MKRTAVFLAAFLVLFSTYALADLSTAVDPVRIGVGARPLGMGKAYVGQANGVETLFLNPSGLAELHSWEFTSMYGRFVNEIGYMMAGFATPLPFGTLGLGIVNAGLSIATPLAEVDISDGEIRIIPSTTEATRYDYNNGVLLVNLSRKVRDDLSLGGNFKLFKTTLTGAGATTADNAQGINFDLAATYHPDTWWRAGINLQNALPASLGGGLVYGDNYYESIGHVIKTGASFRIFGQENSLLKGEQTLILNTDYDVSFKVPGLMHLGGELWLLPELALRAGIDQDLVGAGTLQNNISAGVGIKVQGIRFDFAYHEYNGVSDNTTYYFSLTTVPMPKKMEIEEEVEAFEWYEPQDKTITLNNQVEVRGKVIDRKNVAILKFNDQGIAYYSDGTFTQAATLDRIRNKLKVEAFNGLGESLKKEERKLIKLRTFPDVPNDYWAKRQIDLCYTADIAVGYPDGWYKPDQVITKAELTAFLMKTRTDDFPRQTRIFTDVPDTYWAAKQIYLANQLGLVKGYKNIFNPERKLTRGEAASMMVKILQIELPPSVLEPPYVDIPGRHKLAREVQALKTAGMLDFIKGEFFEPNKGLTRAEAIDMISRSRMGQEKIENLWVY